MDTPKDLLSLTQRELWSRLVAGHPIEETALDDMEYRGTSLGMPAIVERLTWKKFKKVFHRDPSTRVLRGWNVRIVQGPLDEPWVAQEKRGRPVTFGHFHVVETKRPPYGLPPCLVLDYGLGGNRRGDPLSLLRDPIVSLREGSADLLLGWSYLEVRGVRVRTPSFFCLERDVPLGHRVPPPRAGG